MGEVIQMQGRERHRSPFVPREARERERVDRIRSAFGGFLDLMLQGREQRQSASTYSLQKRDERSMAKANK